MVFTARSTGGNLLVSSGRERSSMTEDESLFRSALSRRGLLTTAGVTGAGAALSLLVAQEPALAAPDVALRAGSPAAARVNGLHVQFGADASREVVVSWHALSPVTGARVMVGAEDGRYERSVAATTRTYTDAKSGHVVVAQHARLTGLRPGHRYIYAAVHRGAEPEVGSFSTAPHGRATFTFTSFGDQGTPTLGKRFTPSVGVDLPNPPFVNDNLGSPAAGDLPAGVERVRPLLHLFNGDLCYANLAEDRVRKWSGGGRLARPCRRTGGLHRPGTGRRSSAFC